MQDAIFYHGCYYAVDFRLKLAWADLEFYLSLMFSQPHSRKVWDIQPLPFCKGVEFEQRKPDLWKNLQNRNGGGISADVRGLGKITSTSSKSQRCQNRLMLLSCLHPVVKFYWQDLEHFSHPLESKHTYGWRDDWLGDTHAGVTILLHFLC